MNTDSTRILKFFTENPHRLLKKKVHLENQLIDTLKLYYHAALKLFCVITHHISLAFLLKYPSPLKPKQLSFKKLTSVLKKYKYTKPQRAQRIFASLQKDYPYSPDIFIEAKKSFIIVIIPHIKLINQQLDRYNQKIKNHYDRLLDQDIFDKLPAIGQNIGPPLSNKGRKKGLHRKTMLLINSHY